MLFYLKRFLFYCDAAFRWCFWHVEQLTVINDYSQVLIYVPFQVPALPHLPQLKNSVSAPPTNCPKCLVFFSATLLGFQQHA